MKEEKVHTLILGAGPSGLAAGHALAVGGRKPILIEKSTFSGGLMRSIHRNGFIVDLGRKELYNRIDKVDRFWSGLLGSDYRPYAHRGGVLYDGHIIDSLPNYQGFRRGMPWSMFMKMVADFVRWRLKPGRTLPVNLQERYYRQRGELLTRIFSQAFQEKLTGRPWADTPVDKFPQTEEQGLFSTLRAAFQRAFSTVEPNNYKGIWRHPARGTGQICERMEETITANGGRIEYQSQITAIDVTADHIDAVTVQTPAHTVRFRPEHVIASIPIEFLLKLLPGYGAADTVSRAAPAALRHTVVLVYLMFNHPPKFPQAYLYATCPKTRIGRITNFSAYSDQMVPPGKSCLCCEVYCFGEDELLKLTDKEIAEGILKDCGINGLGNPSLCIDQLVLRLPGADASQNKDNWINKRRLEMVAQLGAYRNVYYTNRTELDIATLAGIEAAEAITAGSRTEFDRHIDPDELGIRSEDKAFAFA
jgi:protoporphyrinogen oxidase